MEVKKSPKADLENKKGLFLEIGLAIALICSIMAFSVSQKEKTIDKFDNNMAAVEEEIAEITHQEQQKPPEPQAAPPQTMSDVMAVVKNDAKITNDFTFADFGEDFEIPKPVEKKEEIIQSEEPVFRAEEMPKFQGGEINDKFRKWVYSKLDYPEVARENHISGKVNMKFIVEKDGSLTDIEILSSPDKLLTDEALRVMKLSPKWTPGKQGKVPVRTWYTFSIDFQLQSN